MDIAINKKARFNNEIFEEIEAGIVLSGSEIKSVRQKKISVSEAYAVFRKNELYLLNSRVEPYLNASHFNHDPERSRKLLLKRKQLDRLKGKLQQKGWVLVVLKVYLKDSKAKVLLGLGQAKKRHDKRQTIKERDIARDVSRDLKYYK